MSYGDWANRQEPVYNVRGELVGVVAENGLRWVAADVSGSHQEQHSTRRQAEQAVQGWARGVQVARRPQQVQQPELGLDQVAGAVMAGAALFGGLAALFGGIDQPARTNDAADELRRQNDELRRQNDLLRQALGQVGPQAITKRR